MPVNIWKPKGERYYRYRYRIESGERLARRVADKIFLEEQEERDGYGAPLIVSKWLLKAKKIPFNPLECVPSVDQGDSEIYIVVSKIDAF